MARGEALSLKIQNVKRKPMGFSDANCSDQQMLQDFIGAHSALVDWRHFRVNGGASGQ